MSEKEEIETKFEVDDLEPVVRIFVAHFGDMFGFCYSGKETVMYFDNKNKDLRATGDSLRIKRTAISRGRNRNALTFKCDNHSDDQFKNFKELEVKISNFETMVQILNLLGYDDIFSYKKNREHWSSILNGGESVEFDKLENGRCFVEIEASPERIKYLAKILDLDWKRATTKGYVEILKGE